MKKPAQWTFSRALLASAVGLATMQSASALEFSQGELEGSLNSQLSIGASWSMENADKNLLAKANGGTGFSSTGDDGKQNFKKGQTFSEIVKGVHELSLNYRNYGAFVRGKYWYDRRLKDGNVEHGHVVTGYDNARTSKKLDDSQFDNLAKFSGAAILDAYVFGEFEMGDVLADIRVGRQVVSWGESTFIRDGINAANPVDLNAFRRPGAEIKEGLLPVNMVYGNLSVTENLSVETFYQLEWKKTVIDGCGTFFASTDVVATGCDKLTLSGNQVSDANAIASNRFVKRVEDKKPKDSGQYGIAFRYFSPELNDTEFGVYYMNYHSRLPFFGGVAGIPTDANPLIPQKPAVYSMDFPEDIELFGVSFSTTAGDFSVAGEVSHRPDQPVGLNSTDLLFGALTGGKVGLVKNRFTPDKPFTGYDRFPVTQAQVTVTRFFDQVMGASRLVLLGEVGYSHVNNLTSKDKVRYGRAPVFGIGKGCVPFGAKAGGHDCTNDGYVTSDAWGYRLLAKLTYSNVFSGVNLSPKVVYQHDVDGNSATGVFLEDRQALGFTLAADYLSTYNASISYNTFWGGKYNLAKDRDFMSVSFGVSF